MATLVELRIKKVELRIDGSPRLVEVEPGQSLLCVLRDALDLTGCKYGCGEGQCGACTRWKARW